MLAVRSSLPAVVLIPALVAAPPWVGAADSTKPPAPAGRSTSAGAAAPADRLQWFRDAKFGMFIHFGVYSRLGQGEWVMHDRTMQVPDYEKLVPDWNPRNFHAADWVDLARQTGMKYIIVTTKHHDGFNLFASRLTPYNIARTAFGRDLIGELTAEAHKQGVRIGYYHSILDWHHPEYTPRPAWETTGKPTAERDFAKYVEYLKGELRQLCTAYGRIDVIWYDGGWEHTSPADVRRFAAINAMIRRLQPAILINDRSNIPEDFGTPEQVVPAGRLPRPWEACMTMTSNWWGYDAYEESFKSVPQLIHTLVDVVSKGGNLLLNVGPKPDGVIQRAMVERLEGIGRWMKVNGESIYGTHPGPWKPGALPFGRATVKGDTIYLHVFDWPQEPLHVPGMTARVARAHMLQGHAPVPFHQKGADLTLELPRNAPDGIDSVVVLDVQTK